MDSLVVGNGPRSPPPRPPVDDIAADAEKAVTSVVHKEKHVYHPIDQTIWIERVRFPVHHCLMDGHHC